MTQNLTPTPGGEPRYDAETLRKVIVLAERLKNRQQETFSAGEMESIGAEVGLAPGFIRNALSELARPAQPRPPAQMAPRQALATPTRRKGIPGGPIARAWWAGGWALPIVGTLVGAEMLRGPSIAAVVLLGWAGYIGVGVLLSGLVKHEVEEAVEPAEAQSGVEQGMSRASLLDALFVLQHELEGQRRHRAFLSVDVAGSTLMKEGASELAVEHSFGQFRRWVDDIVAYCGGEMQFAAGDGMMCSFADNGAAVRAARLVLDGLPRFNAEQNRLAAPFRLRCGLSAGQVALERGASLGHLHSVVVDRAAALQKQAAPGGIVLGAEMREAAEAELGAVEALPAVPGAGAAFAWAPAGVLPPAPEEPARQSLYRRP